MISKEKIKKAIEIGNTMGGAAKFLNIDWRTFKKIAKKYNLYQPYCNRYGKKYELKDILNGKFPQYNTSHLSKRLIKEGYKQYKCEKCGITEWNNKKISLELNHIDGDSSNHKLKNLELLCPNCHSQTDTYRSKKLKLKLKLSYDKDWNFYKTKKEKPKNINKTKEKKIINKNYCKCGKEIYKKSKMCVDCYNIEQRIVERPSYDILLKEVKELGLEGTGRKYNVTGNSIKKWLKNMEEPIVRG